MLRKFLIGALATGACAAALATGSVFTIQASSVEREGATTTAKDVTIYAEPNASISADSAVVTGGNHGKVPYLVELQGGVDLQIGNEQIYATSARYYPELKTLTSERFVLPTYANKAGPSCDGNQVVVTLPGGWVIRGDTLCTQGALYSCSGGVLTRHAERC